jgi:Tfp pilus assembly protein PilX
MLEVLIAMLLLSIMMLGMAAMQVTVLRTSASSRQMTMATQIAQSRLEEFRTLPFAALPAPQVITDEACFGYVDSKPISLAPCAAATTYFTRKLGIVGTGGVACGQVVMSNLGIQVDVTWTDTEGLQTVSLCLERSQ